jgi:hypothetical protein
MCCWPRSYNEVLWHAASLDRSSVSSPDGGAAQDEAAAPAAAAERDVLLATKLHIPPPRPGFLPRPRLLERVTQGTALGPLRSFRVCGPPPSRGW